MIMLKHRDKKLSNLAGLLDFIPFIHSFDDQLSVHEQAVRKLDREIFTEIEPYLGNVYGTLLVIDILLCLFLPFNITGVWSNIFYYGQCLITPLVLIFLGCLAGQIAVSRNKHLVQAQKAIGRLKKERAYSIEDAREKLKNPEVCYGFLQTLEEYAKPEVFQTVKNALIKEQYNIAVDKLISERAELERIYKKLYIEENTVTFEQAYANFKDNNAQQKYY